ncbi:MAG TPA: N-acetylmuramoyl-L-alanine amidase [Candidatus Eremiobacteraceae bacterium]|nr:N-acetylmuramoyl-L-alanine amidase [Candidatus Eremiobacteraceae bacterium]
MNALLALLAAALTIVYPGPGAQLPAVSRSFVFGASPPGSHVVVNGTAAHSASDGGWIAYVPLVPGDFTLNVSAEGDRMWYLQRRIHVAAPLRTDPPAPARFDGALSPQPYANLVVRVGDVVRLQVKGSTGASASATVGDEGPVQLTETELNGARGVYEGQLRVRPSTRSQPLPVTYTLRSANGAAISARARGRVTVDASAQPAVGSVALTRTADGQRPYGVVMRSPGNDWFLFPPAGTPFAIEGKDGNFFRVEAGGGVSGYIYKDNLRIEPPDTPSPSAALNGIETSDFPTESVVEVHLSSRVPFTLAESSAATALKLALFSTDAGTGALTISGAAEGISSITRMAAPAGALGLRIALRQHSIWGYHVSWAGNDLEISIKKPPHMDAAPRPALRGLLVVVDPGHSPDAGAVGPLGTQERVVNLEIARRLAYHLGLFGARTLLTRTDESGPGLYDRTLTATAANADVLISVHNNAWPDGTDPATQLGYSVYYYHAESLDLARAIHAAYARETQLPDAGLFREDFALVRPTEQPSVLTESAFITWPDEEQLLLSPPFIDRLGATLADGLERWAEARRALETPRQP